MEDIDTENEQIASNMQWTIFKHTYLNPCIINSRSHNPIRTLPRGSLDNQTAENSYPENIFSEVDPSNLQS